MDLEGNVGYEAGVNAAKNSRRTRHQPFYNRSEREKKIASSMGNKQGAAAAINNLERDDLGVVVSNKAQGTAKICIQTQAACYH